MYCRKCGKQNPDDAFFCNKCGAELNGAPVNSTWQNSSFDQTTPAWKPAPKKKSNGVLIAIVTVVAFAVFSVCGFFAVKLLTKLPEVDPSSNGTPSSAYSNVFLLYGPEMPDSDFVGQNLKTASYAIHLGDNMLENIECVYDDGIVLVMVDSIYVPVDGLDSAAKAQVNTTMLSNLKTYTDLSFCQLSSYEYDGYYVYKLIFTGLDEKENVHQLSGTGLISLPEGESKVDQIGIKQTEESLLAGGYSKR